MTRTNLAIGILASAVGVGLGTCSKEAWKNFQFSRGDEKFGNSSTLVISNLEISLKRLEPFRFSDATVLAPADAEKVWHELETIEQGVSHLKRMTKEKR